VIDGIKMLPTARVSPCADAERKVRLIRPRGRVVLDTCSHAGFTTRLDGDGVLAIRN